jgi:uncharacterized membrane protein YphA (DoxX/SURF4 family)
MVCLLGSWLGCPFFVQPRWPVSGLEAGMRGGKYLILLAEHPAHWVGTAFTRQGSQVRTLWCPPKIPRFFKSLQHQLQAIAHTKVVNFFVYYFCVVLLFGFLVRPCSWAGGGWEEGVTK